MFETAPMFHILLPHIFRVIYEKQKKNQIEWRYPKLRVKSRPRKMEVENYPPRLREQLPHVLLVHNAMRGISANLPSHNKAP